jgi:hypothetical protein
MAPNFEFRSVKGFRLVSWVICQGGRHNPLRHTLRPLYPGAQVVRVERSDAPADFTL